MSGLQARLMAHIKNDAEHEPKFLQVETGYRWLLMQYHFFRSKRPNVHDVDFFLKFQAIVESIWFDRDE